MKIALVSDFFYPELSGITDSVVLFGKALAARGHEVLFVVPKYSTKDYAVTHSVCTDDSLGSNMRVVRLPSISLPGSPTKQSRIVLPTGAAWRALKKFKPDIIHTHSPYIPGLEAAFFARQHGIPLVGTHHTPISEFVRGPRWFVRMLLKYASWYYNKCRYVSAPCQSLLDEMIAYGLLAQHAVVPNPINVSHFGPAISIEERNELKKRFSVSPHTILYTGRLAEEKHVDVIVHALPIVKKVFPDVTLAICGHGKAEGSLRSLVEKLNCENNVRFLGYIEDDIFPLVYKASDVFVIMSTAESQSLSLMQAMTSGMPVIGARARALPEYITSDNGVVVDVGDHECLARELIALFTDRNRATALGKNGITSAALCSPENIAVRWENIYSQRV